jgi:hypothetical protein
MVIKFQFSQHYLNIHPHFPLEIAKRSVDFSIWANLLQTDQISSFARFAVDEMKVLLSRKDTRVCHMSRYRIYVCTGSYEHSCARMPERIEGNVLFYTGSLNPVS